jgi:hypothetical protein
MPEEFHVPASGEIAWQYFPVPTKFTEDKWIQAVEARPGNPAVVHHIRIFSRAPGSKAFMEPDPQTSQERQHPKEPPKDDGSGVLAGPDIGAEELAAFVPGGDPVELQPGQALLVRAGSDLVLEVHYTTTGKPQTDRSRVGLIFAKWPPQMRVSFNSQTTKVCKVSGTTVTLNATGTCTIQATQAGNSNWAAATPVNQSFQVIQKK